MAYVAYGSLVEVVRHEKGTHALVPVETVAVRDWVLDAYDPSLWHRVVGISRYATGGLWHLATFAGLRALQKQPIFTADRWMPVPGPAVLQPCDGIIGLEFATSVAIRVDGVVCEAWHTPLVAPVPCDSCHQYQAVRLRLRGAPEEAAGAGTRAGGAL